MTRKTIRPTGTPGTIRKDRVAAPALRRSQTSPLLARFGRSRANEQADVFPCCPPPCCMRNLTIER